MGSREEEEEEEKKRKKESSKENAANGNMWPRPDISNYSIFFVYPFSNSLTPKNKHTKAHTYCFVCSPSVSTCK